MADDLKSIPFDLYTRNTLINEIILINQDSKDVIKILDVGGRNGQLSAFINKEYYYIMDIMPIDTDGSDRYLRGSSTRIPFKDNAFNVVVCSDVYEHITYSEREKAISEMLRVSKDLVILGAPFNSQEVKMAESSVNDFFIKYKGGEHPWLKEHIDNGLPESEVLESFLKKNGYQFVKIGTNNLENWILLQLFNNCEGIQYGSPSSDINRFYNENYCELGDFIEPTYRKIYIISKNSSPLEPTRNINIASKDWLKTYEFIKGIIYTFNSSMRSKEQELTVQKNTINTLEQKNSSLTNEVKALENLNTSLSLQLNHTMQDNTSLTGEVKALSAEIADMKRSALWQLTMKYHVGFVERFMPPDTHRRHAYDLMLKSLRVFTAGGIAGLWSGYNAYRAAGRNEKSTKAVASEGISEPCGMEIYDKLYLISLDHFNHRPKISILMPVYNIDKKWLVKAIESVRSQYYTNWELCIVDDASTRSHIKETLERYRVQDNRIKIVYLDKNRNISGATNEALKLATGEYVGFMDHDDELTNNALFEIVKLLNEHPDADIIYSDDDKIDEYGNRYDFQFKPDWNPELLLSYCYFSHIKVFRKNILERVGGFRSEYDGSQDYDLTLRATELTDRIYHIPKVLYHWRCLPNSTARSADEKPESMERGRAAVQDAVLRRGIAGKVIIPDFALKSKNGIYKINFQLKDTPKMSIIIPTKDKIQLLAACIKSIEEKTTYPNYEIVIVDTGSKQKETLEYLNSTSHKVLKLPLEKFSFSKVINYAVANVDSEYVLFLNNDTEVITPSWLEELVGYMQLDKKIGAVGAKLIYADGRVQHAGVILGLNNGLAGHANKLRQFTDGGYLNYSNVARDYSAVTAACMLTRKSCFKEVGGLDEDRFAIAYNDVDYCLKLIEHGYRIVYNPYVMLYHFEGSTRGIGANNDDPAEELNFRAKWANVIRTGDPLYNTNLSLDNELFTIKNSGNINKKLFFITHNLSLEGAPISEYLLVEGLAARGYDITVVSCCIGPMAERYINLGVNLAIMPEMLSNEATFKRFLKQNRFDFAYINTIITYPLIKAIKERKIPLVWVIRESEREYYFNSYEGLSTDHFKMADSIVFVSNATRNIYADLEYNGNFTTIYNGIDIRRIEDFKKLNKKEELKKQYNFSNNDTVITVVGTTCERKGQKYFMEAAINILKTTNRSDLQFLVVGARDIPYLQELVEMVENSGYKDNIHFIKETDKVFSYYLISDIFACTSLVESLPRVILEAMAFELPIIASNIYGIPEEIEDKKSGILVKAGDAVELSNQILNLIENKDMARDLARNAFLSVKTKFGVAEMTDNYESLIKSIME